jgi:hypothetical protein
VPKREKYATKAGLVHSSKRSSRDLVGSGTIPKIAMSTAPPAMKSVPRIIHGEKTSPRMKRAKKAFQRRDTAPSGARITTGRDAIWTRAPMIFEDMNMAGEEIKREERMRHDHDGPKPSSHKLVCLCQDILWRNGMKE